MEMADRAEKAWEGFNGMTGGGEAIERDKGLEANCRGSVFAYGHLRVCGKRK
jgi:hypothetical protein